MLFGCLAAPARHRTRRPYPRLRGFVVVATVATLMHPIFVDPVSWAVIRAATGFCVAGLYATIESWMHDKADNVVRGRMLAIYQIVNYAGAAAGQQAIRFISATSMCPFSIIASALALSVLPLAYTRSDRARAAAGPRLRLAWLFRISPVGVVGAMASGSANGTVLVAEMKRIACCPPRRRRSSRSDRSPACGRAPHCRPCRASSSRWWRKEPGNAEPGRGADHRPGHRSTKIGCMSVATVATTTKAAKARIWPARAMTRGAARQPNSIPPK